MAALLLGQSDAFAHGRSVSYSSWELEAGGAEVSVRLKLLELSRLGPEALPPGSVPGFVAALAALHGPPGCGKTYAVDQLVEFLDWPISRIAATVQRCSPNSTSKPCWLMKNWLIRFGMLGRLMI